MKNYYLVFAGLIIAGGCASLQARGYMAALLAEALKGQTFMVSPAMKKSWQDYDARKIDFKANEFTSAAEAIQDPATKKAYQELAEKLKKVAQHFKESHVPVVPIALSMQYAPQWASLNDEMNALKDRMHKKYPDAAKGKSIVVPAALVKSWHDLAARKLDLKAKEFDALALGNKEQPIVVKQSKELAAELRLVAKELAAISIPAAGITKSMKNVPAWKALEEEGRVLKARQLHEFKEQIKARLTKGKGHQAIAKAKKVEAA